MAAVTPAIGTMPDYFVLFSKFGDPKSDGKTMTLSQSDKWMKQAGIFGKQITMTDTGVCWNKFKCRTLDLKNYEKFLEDLAKTKKADYREMIQKMLECGLPGENPANPTTPKR